MSTENKTGIQVAVRCRPVNAEEKKNLQPSVVTCDTENKSIKLSYGAADKKINKDFFFDRVFGACSKQEELFDAIVRPIVDETLAGFNCTIFAYGQTGTGKTHTMEGDLNSEEDVGIVPRSVRAILEQLEDSLSIQFAYLFWRFDLLVSKVKKTSGATSVLKLMENSSGVVSCQNLREIYVKNTVDALSALKLGISRRKEGATEANQKSSRSHTIFTLKIEVKESESITRYGQLNLVDLAGSECSSAKTTQETASINQSLSTLGRVITSIVDRDRHVPYRDSKLTRLLQQSLNGKTKTCFIATLSPMESAVEQTLSTLKFVTQTKSIQVDATVNRSVNKQVTLPAVSVVDSAVQSSNQDLLDMMATLLAQNKALLEAQLVAKEHPAMPSPTPDALLLSTQVVSEDVQIQRKAVDSSIPPAEWDKDQVGDWLAAIGLGKYADVFIHRKIAGYFMLNSKKDDQFRGLFNDDELDYDMFETYLVKLKAESVAPKKMSRKTANNVRWAVKPSSSAVHSRSVAGSDDNLSVESLTTTSFERDYFSGHRTVSSSSEDDCVVDDVEPLTETESVTSSPRAAPLRTPAKRTSTVSVFGEGVRRSARKPAAKAHHDMVQNYDSDEKDPAVAENDPRGPPIMLTRSMLECELFDWYWIDNKGSQIYLQTFWYITKKDPNGEKYTSTKALLEATARGEMVMNVDYFADETGALDKAIEMYKDTHNYFRNMKSNHT